jgi:hypothetical protein
LHGLREQSVSRLARWLVYESALGEVSDTFWKSKALLQRSEKAIFFRTGKQVPDPILGRQEIVEIKADDAVKEFSRKIQGIRPTERHHAGLSVGTLRPEAFQCAMMLMFTNFF